MGMVDRYHPPNTHHHPSLMTVLCDQWKPIQGYPNYEVSDSGKVRNTKTKRLLALNTKKGTHPYQRAHLSHDGHARYLLVHRLVLEAFVGPCPEGHQCLHLDDNPRNNHLSNLRWGTVAENHSTIDRKGAKNGRAKLTPEDVKLIRSWTGPLKELADRYDVNPRYLTNIRCNITWKHL